MLLSEKWHGTEDSIVCYFPVRKTRKEKPTYISILFFLTPNKAYNKTSQEWKKKFSRNHLTVLLKQVNFMVCKLHPNKAVKKKNKRSGRKGNCFKNSYLDIQHCRLHYFMLSLHPSKSRLHSGSPHQPGSLFLFHNQGNADLKGWTVDLIQRKWRPDLGEWEKEPPGHSGRRTRWQDHLCLSPRCPLETGPQCTQQAIIWDIGLPVLLPPCRPVPGLWISPPNTKASALSMAWGQKPK